MNLRSKKNEYGSGLVESVMLAALLAVVAIPSILAVGNSAICPLIDVSVGGPKKPLNDTTGVGLEECGHSENVDTFFF